MDSMYVHLCTLCITSRQSFRENTVQNIYKYIFSWFHFQSNQSKIFEIQPRNISQQEIYLFESRWRRHLSRCTAEKASLYLTCVKNIIIEAEGFQMYRFSSSSILHISHFFYTTTIWGLKILHLKVRKCTTKVASLQNSVNLHSGAQIHITNHVWNINTVC